MRTGNFLFLFFLFFLVFNLSSFDNSDDSSELSKKIKEYDDNKISIALKPFVLNMDEDERKTFYQDKVPFDVYRGNGKKTKLSFLAEEMGNRTLAQKLRLGENHHIFVPCFAVSVAVSAVFQISGIAALSASFSTTQDASGNETYYQNEYGKYLVPMGAALLGLSSVSFVGIFVFSFLMYFASPYNFNQTQGKSFINNYNNFLKKKLGIPKDINLSYDFKNNKFDLSMSINF